MVVCFPARLACLKLMLMFRFLFDSLMHKSGLLVFLHIPTFIKESHLIQLTTRWWSVDSSAPLFTRVSRTCGRRSADTTIKSIIDLRPRVSWCQVHRWTSLCSNMVFVMAKLRLAQKSNNWTPLRFRSGRPFLPTTPLQVMLSLPTWALKSPNRTTELPGGNHSRTPPRDSKKAGYSELLIGA